MQRHQRWTTGMGAAAGVLVWAYDYDFFVNAGGPGTPISHAILRINQYRSKRRTGVSQNVRH